MESNENYSNKPNQIKSKQNKFCFRKPRMSTQKEFKLTCFLRLTGNEWALGKAKDLCDTT